MIIELSKSIIEDIKNLSNENLISLELLAQSRSRGYNFIIAPKPLLSYIVNIDGLSNQSKETFKKIINDQTKWFNFLKDLSFRVRIVNSNGNISKKIENGINILEVPLDSVDSYKIDREATIIAENIVDIKYYSRIFSAYLKSKNINIRLHFQKANGGGNTTHEVVKNHDHDLNGVSVCVLDSDYTSPWSSVGPTAQKVLNLIPKTRYSYCFLTRSREAENTIPIKILKCMAGKDKGFNDKIDNLSRLIAIDELAENPIKYVDFKKGIKGHITHASCENSNNYWSKALNLANLLKPCNNKIACQKVKDCNCNISEGFGSDLLKSTVNYLELNDFNYKDIDPHLIPEWEYLYKAIVPYMIAPQTST